MNDNTDVAFKAIMHRRVFFISLSVMVCGMDVTSQLMAVAGMLMVHACHHPVFDDKGQKSL